MKHVIIELSLEEVSDLLLYRLISDLRSPSHGAITP